jgi:membrane protease YdiL (CAAX protease family)
MEPLARNLVAGAVNAPPRSVAPFFLLTFALTWGLQAPGLLAQRGWLPGNPNAYLPLAGLGIFGPCVAAIILERRAGGGAAVKQLMATVLHWRAPFRWYVAAVIPAVLLTLGLALLSFAGRRGPVAYVPGASALIVGLVISITEEIGWRGFALPRLQQRWGSVVASAVLAVAWCVWHIPMFIGQGIPLSLLPVMLLFFTGGSLLFTAIYNGTHGSLLAVIFAHWCAHLNNSNRALPGDVAPLLVHTVLYVALGLFVMRREIRQLRTKCTASEEP